MVVKAPSAPAAQKQRPAPATTTKKPAAPVKRNAKTQKKAPPRPTQNPQGTPTGRNKPTNSSTANGRANTKSTPTTAPQQQEERKRDRGIEGEDYPNAAGRQKMKPAVDQLIKKSQDLGVEVGPFADASNRFFSDPAKDTYETFKTEFGELQGIGPRNDARRAQNEADERKRAEDEKRLRERDGDAIARLRDGRLTGDQFREQLGDDENIFKRYRSGDMNWQDLSSAYGTFGSALDASKRVGGRELEESLYSDMAGNSISQHRALSFESDALGRMQPDKAWNRIQELSDEHNLSANKRSALARNAANEMETNGKVQSAGSLVARAQYSEQRQNDRKQANLAAARIAPGSEQNFQNIDQMDRMQDEFYQQVLNADSLTGGQVDQLTKSYDDRRDEYLEKTYGEGGPEFGASEDAQTVENYLNRSGSSIANQAILRRAERHNRDLVQQGRPPDERRLNSELERAANDPGTDLRNLQLGTPLNRRLPQNLRSPVLRNHDLTNRDLSGSDLRNVRMTRSNLQGANLTHVDVTGGQFDRTNFGGANLTRTKGLDDANMRGAFFDSDTRFPPGFDPKKAGMVQMVTPRDSFDVHRANTIEMFKPQLNAHTLQASGQYPNPLHGQKDQPALVDQDRFFQNRTTDHQTAINAQAESEQALLEKHGGWAGAQKFLGTEADKVARGVLKDRGLDPSDPNNKTLLDQQTTQARENLSQMMVPLYGEATGRVGDLEGDKFTTALDQHFADVRRERLQAAEGSEGVSQQEIDRYWAGLPQDKLSDLAENAWDNQLSEDDRKGVMQRMIGERADLVQTVLSGQRHTQRQIAGTQTRLRENADYASILGNGVQNHRTADYAQHLRARVSDSIDHASDAVEQIRKHADAGDVAYADALYRDMFTGQGTPGLYRPLQHVDNALEDYAKKVQPNWDDIKNAGLRGGVEHIMGMGQAVKDHPVEAGALATITAGGLYFAPEITLPVLFAVGAKSAFDNSKEGIRLWQEGQKNNNVNQMLQGAGHIGAAGVDTAFLAADGVATLNAFRSAKAVKAANGLSAWQYPKFALTQRAGRLADAAQRTGQWIRRKPAAPDVGPTRPPEAPTQPAPGTQAYDEMVSQLRTKETMLERMQRGLERRRQGPLPESPHTRGRSHGNDGLPTRATAEQAAEQVRKLEADITRLKSSVSAADQQAALLAQQRVQRVLQERGLEAAVAQARKEGIAFRSLNDKNIADILDGNGILARGNNGSPNAMRDTLYYDGSPGTQNSAFTPTTEAPPGLLPKGDPNNYVAVDSRRMQRRGQYVPQDKLPPEPNRTQWLDQQKHTMTIGDIQAGDIAGMRLRGVDYTPAELQSLVGRVKKFDQAYADGNTVTLLQSGPPHGHMTMPKDDFLKMTGWKAEELADLNRAFQLYVDPTPPNRTTPAIIHSLDY